MKISDDSVELLNTFWFLVKEADGWNFYKVTWGWKRAVEGEKSYKLD